MKKWFIITLGCCLFFKANSQTYHPIPTDSVWWVERSSGPYMGSLCIQFIYEYVYPVNEVNLHGETYTEFRSNGVVEYDYFGPPPSSCPPSGYSFSNYLYAYIRNDSANHKVYEFDTMNTNQEKLLYDFDLDLGDTVQPYNSCPDDTFIVQNIDSVDIGGTYRRRFELITNGFGWSPIYLIEGIGSNIGFAHPNYCPFEYNTFFVCYHHKNWEYGEVGSEYCTQTLTAPSIENEFVMSISTLESNQFGIGYDAGSMKISCIDMTGKTIYQTTLEQSGIIDLNHLLTGMYTLILTHEPYLKSFKVSIQH